MTKFLYLFLGGGLGTFARYLMAGAVYQVCGVRFPYGTLAVNLSGCFLAGFLAVVIEEKFLLSPTMRLAVMVGFLGGFTTFSTFILETANLIKDGQNLLAFVNVMTSVAVGFLVFRMGVVLGKVI